MTRSDKKRQECEMQIAEIYLAKAGATSPSSKDKDRKDMKGGPQASINAVCLVLLTNAHYA